MNNFRACRERASLTQQELADIVNVDRSSISKWESGDFLPRTEKLPLIARTLDCSIDELLGNERGGTS